MLAAVFAPFKGCNPDVDFLHRGAIVDGWRASLSPHRGARERRGELVHRLCVQLRACRRRALGASPIRPTLADGRSPSSSISACSVFARLPCRIMDGRELSEGELESVARAVGGIDAVIDPKAKDADTVALVQYLAADQKFEKVLDNQQILREPIVRNGRQATVGYEPDVWKGWE